MKEKNKNKILIKMLGIMFVLFAFFLYGKFSVNNGLMDQLLIVITVYIFSYLGLYILFERFINKYKILSFIYERILGIPVLIFLAYGYYTAPILAILVFLLIYFAPSLILIELSNYYNFLSLNAEGMIYLISLVAVILFTYKGYVVMDFIIKTFETVFGKDILYKLTSKQNTRIISYCLMIGIYVLYNISIFSGYRFLSIIPVEILNVIKEVFVTFVAVDTLMQMLIQKKIVKIEIHGNKELK